MPHKYVSSPQVFRVFIGLGFLLGIVLLLQTISTEVYVSQSMTQQFARRDGELKAASVERIVRAGGAADSTELAAVLEDSLGEWKTQVAWVRVLDVDGKPIASAGPAPKTIVARDKLPRPFTDATTIRQADFQQTPTPEGPALVAIYPFRPAAPGGPRPGGTNGANGPGSAANGSPPTASARPAYRGRAAAIEIAVLLDGVSAPLARLRVYLVVGVSASLALMGSLVLIIMKFLPNYLHSQQIEGQLELARRVQSDLLPSSDPVSPNIDFSAECISASQVGGDFCDVFNVKNDCTAIVLGDVSGKGVSAALLMALIHGAIHSTSWTDSPEDHETASRKLNALLCNKTARERFATLFWGSFNPRTSILRYINAGHLPPLLLRMGASGKLEVIRLETGGPVLGLLPGVDYTQGETAISPGDLLVVFSDGIIEANNPAGDDFGDERLLEVLQECWNLPASEIRNTVHARVKAFVSHAPVHDDQTLIVIRFKHSATGSAGSTRAERGKTLAASR